MRTAVAGFVRLDLACVRIAGMKGLASRNPPCAVVIGSLLGVG